MVAPAVEPTVGGVSEPYGQGNEDAVLGSEGEAELGGDEFLPGECDEGSVEGEVGDPADGVHVRRLKIRDWRLGCEALGSF